MITFTLISPYSVKRFCDALPSFFMSIVFDDPFSHPEILPLYLICLQKILTLIDVPSNSMDSASVAAWIILNLVTVVGFRGYSVFASSGVSATVAITFSSGSGEVSSYVLLASAAA